jgi:hypothetical protein
VKRVLVATLVSLVAFLSLAAGASAEQAVLPGGSLPWTDPAHNSPLEQVASSFATEIADRPVRVQCHSEAEWAALGLPSGALGVVRYLYNVYTGVIVATEDVAHIRESVCGWTQLFGQTPQKPTRCATVESVSRTVYDTVRVKKKVFYWMRTKLKNGHTKRVRKSKYIWATKRVPRTVTEEVPGPRVPCYGSSEALPAEYRSYSIALEVIAHESIHLFDERVGYRIQTQASAESRAECFGMQVMPPWASILGADVDDARAIGKYYWEQVYPGWGTSSPYWRPDCVPNGPLDVTPNDGYWPRIAADPLPGPKTNALAPLAWGYRS